MEFLIQITITTTVTALAILLIKTLFSKKMSAKWQYYIWLVLLIRILVPVLPQSPLSVFNYTPSVQQVTIQPAPDTASQSPVSSPVQGNLSQGAQQGADAAYSEEEKTSRPQSAQTGAQQPFQGAQNEEEKLYIRQVVVQNPIRDTQTTLSLQDWVMRAVLWVWLGGAVLLGGYFVAVYAVFSYRVKRYARIYSAGYGPLLQKCKKKVGVKRRVHLRLYGNTPMLKGVFSPVILLPRQYEEQPLEQVLIHELCHLRHHDVLIGFLATAILCLFWYNPVIWLCYSTFKKDTELLCDYHVVQAGGNKKLYAQVLLETALEKNQFIPMTTSLQNGKKEIVKRIEHLARFKKPKVIWGIVLLILLAAVCVFFLTNRAGSDTPSLSMIEGMQLPRQVEESPAYQQAMQQADAIVYGDTPFTTSARILDKWEKLKQGQTQNICVYVLDDTSYEVYRFAGTAQAMQQTHETYAALADVGQDKALDIQTQQNGYFSLTDYGFLSFGQNRTDKPVALPVVQISETSASEYYALYETYLKPVRSSLAAQEYYWMERSGEEILRIAGDYNNGELWQTYGDNWPADAVEQALKAQHIDTAGIDISDLDAYNAGDNTVYFPEENRLEKAMVRITGYEQDGDILRISFDQLDYGTGRPLAGYILTTEAFEESFRYVSSVLSKSYPAQGHEIKEDGLYVYFPGYDSVKVPAEGILEETYHTQWDVSVGQTFAKAVVKNQNGQGYTLYSTQDCGQTWEQRPVEISGMPAFAYALDEISRVLVSFADPNNGYVVFQQDYPENTDALCLATQNGGESYTLTSALPVPSFVKISQLRYYTPGDAHGVVQGVWLLGCEAESGPAGYQVYLYRGIWAPERWGSDSLPENSPYEDNPLYWQKCDIALANEREYLSNRVILPEEPGRTEPFSLNITVRATNRDGTYDVDFYSNDSAVTWYGGDSRQPVSLTTAAFDPITDDVYYKSSDEDALSIAVQLMERAEWLSENWTAGRTGEEQFARQADGTIYYLYDWIEKYKTPEDVYYDFDNTFVPKVLDWRLDAADFRNTYRLFDGKLYNAQWMSYNFGGPGRYYSLEGMRVVEKMPDTITVECTLELPMAQESQKRYIRIVKIEGRWLIDDSYFADAVRPEMDEDAQAVFDKYLQMEESMFSPFVEDFDEENPLKIKDPYLLRNCLGYSILGDSDQIDEAMMNGQPLDASFMEDPILHYFPCLTREDIQAAAGEEYDPATNTYSFQGGYGGGGYAPLFRLEYTREGDILHITLREYESETFWVLKFIKEFTIQDYDDGSFAYLSLKITSYNYWDYYSREQ